MPEKFNREQRYVVLKLKDLNQYATDEERQQLEKLCNTIASRQPKQRNYVVVEDDWPEYEVVWKMIATRMARAEKFVSTYRAYLSAIGGTEIKINNVKPTDCTCYNCALQHKCMSTYDLYNVDGDCLEDI